jgi:hypothetical protein
MFDPFQDHFGNAGWTLIAATGISEVCSLVRERSQLALARLLEDGFVAGAAFVDGSRTFHNVFVDLTFLRDLVRPGGLIILDDCQWSSVATAARYFEVNADGSRSAWNRKAGCALIACPIHGWSHVLRTSSRSGSTRHPDRSGAPYRRHCGPPGAVLLRLRGGHSAGRQATGGDRMGEPAEHERPVEESP